MEEAIMILIDNSYHATEDAYVFQAQLEAIRLYARAKLKSNPQNRLGVATLGGWARRLPESPHSDIERFLTHTLDIPWGGEFSILSGFSRFGFGFATVPLDMKKRVLVFLAGYIGRGYLVDILLKFGKSLKKNGIALDLVSIEYEDQEIDTYKTELLGSVVELANRADNSHFARLPRHSSSSSVRDILVSSKILSRSEAQAVQEDPEEEPISSSSPPPVIFPACVQAPQNQKLLLFGSWQMHQLQMFYHLQVPENYKKHFVFGSFQV